MHKIILVSLFFVSLVLTVHGLLPLIRQTTNGSVEGIEQISSLGQKYYAFRGIRYAEPPISGIDPYNGEKVDRRFKVKYINNV